MPRKALNREQTQRALGDLCRAFVVPRPKLLWSPGFDHGTTVVPCYPGNPVRGEVHLGPNAGNGVEATLIHEFGHVLYYYRTLIPESDRHNNTYFHCLVDVAEYYYGHPRRYDWNWEKGSNQEEYHQLYLWAKEAGLCK